MPKKPKKWIAGAIEKEGALHRDMRREYGDDAFTKRGTIKVKYLDKAARKKTKAGKDTKIAKRARLAKNLRKARKKKG